MNFWRYSGDLRSGATKINPFSAFGGSAAQRWHARVEECRAARLVVTRLNLTISNRCGAGGPEAVTSILLS